MRLATKLVIRVKYGFLPYLINEIYKRGCSARNISLVENDHGADLFIMEILHSAHDEYIEILKKIEKYEDSFQIISSENILDKEITGGLLKITGKMRIDNLIDFEMNVLGAAELNLSKLRIEEDKYKYSGISKNIGLICGISGSKDLNDNYLKLYTIAERDSVIINRFAGFNSFPVLIKYNQIDDFIKILQGIESTFSAIRILTIENIEDISSFERIYDILTVPVLAQDYDEIPLYLLIALYHLFSRNNIDIRSCTAGIIGINISSLRTARLLMKLGFPRVLGTDNNIKLLHGFEKEGGLATTRENIFENSDIIIIIKDFNIDCLSNIGSGQILISLIEKKYDEGIMKEKGVRDILQSGWMDLSAFFPGMLKGLMESKMKYMNDDMLIKLSKRISELKSKDEVLPNIFSDVHQKIPELIGALNN